MDFAYDAFGRTSAITRYADLAATALVAATTFTYDSAGRLAELLHNQGATPLAGYTWTYDSAGQITQFTSLLDGTVTYTHDATGQLTGADYDSQTNESYTYDANGNRTGGGYVVGPNNQLLSDGTFWYEYDPEGNRTLRYVWTDADSDGEVDEGEQSQITEYEWDHRNRLVRVTERESDTGPATQIVEHTYDYLNRWVARSVDPDGDGPLGPADTYFVFDGTPSGVVLLDPAAVTFDQIGQIVLHFEDDAQGTPQLAHRYLWGAMVDQILADEQVTSLPTPGEVLWTLTDHLNTVRDLAQCDPGTGTTTVANHRVFTSFGQLLSETNAAVDHLFAFTGRALDDSTGLQNNLNRWYDPQLGEWSSQDPIGFDGADANLHRAVGNRPLLTTDPSGLLGWGWPSLSDYWYYLRNPSKMDRDLQTKQKIALGTAAVAGGAAAGLAVGGYLSAAYVAEGYGEGVGFFLGGLAGYEAGSAVGYAIGRPLGKDIAYYGSLGGGIIGAFGPLLARGGGYPAPGGAGASVGSIVDGAEQAAAGEATTWDFCPSDMSPFPGEIPGQPMKPWPRPIPEQPGCIYMDPETFSRRYPGRPYPPSFEEFRNLRPPPDP